ncbi:MAG: hypothetical protein AMJ43_07945 [Coxiella sp. DG_40]|nr:MAG: hypothetical protein AMJ43_07945 [Coxiella sp. DG_40]
MIVFLFKLFIFSLCTPAFLILFSELSHGATGHASAEVVVKTEPVDIWQCDDEGNCYLIKAYE